jgi:HAD superfamily hydrolase (TIGR01509 family)
MTLARCSTFDLTGVTTLLCDADGTLFPSEDLAYTASAVVTQEFAAQYGLRGTFTPEDLQRVGRGRNFRATAQDLLAAAGIDIDASELDGWVDRERDEVTAHLQTALAVDQHVVSALDALRSRFTLAVVTSSAAGRVAACCAATGLDRFFAADSLFSAEDSLAVPISKPDPAVYRHALESLGIAAAEAIAIEDSVAGTRSAVAAAIRTVGLVRFVGDDEREQRTEDLRAAGATAVFRSWPELVHALTIDAG